MNKAKIKQLRAENRRLTRALLRVDGIAFAEYLKCGAAYRLNVFDKTPLGRIARVTSRALNA